MIYSYLLWIRRVWLNLVLPGDLLSILHDILDHSSCPCYDESCDLCRLRRYLGVPR